MPIQFQHSGYETCNAFHTYVQVHLRTKFPDLMSCKRLIELRLRVLIPLSTYLHTQQGDCPDFSIVDSTAFNVYHPAGIQQLHVIRVGTRQDVGRLVLPVLTVSCSQRSGELLAWCLIFKQGLMMRGSGLSVSIPTTSMTIKDQRSSCPMPSVRRLVLPSSKGGIT